MNYLKKYLFLFALILLSTISVKSQMIFDTLNLLETEIISIQYGNRSSIKTQSIDTLTKKELNHLSLGELLTANSTIFVKSYGKGSLATASFRGTAASHTKVLWNGFEINSPMLGQVDLSLIPNNFYDEAQLDYGGSSLETTSGALGGSINLESNKSKNSETINFTQSVGSFKTYTSSLKVNLGNETFNSKTAVYLNSSENSFDFYNNAIIPAEWQTQKNAEYYNRGFTQSFNYKISDRQFLEIISWNQWNFREIPPIMSNQQGGNNEEKQESFTSRNILKWKYQQSNTVVEASGAWFFEDMNYILKTTTTVDFNDTVTNINSTNISKTGYVKAKISQSLQNGWLLSSELKYSKSIVNSINYNDQKSRDHYSIFVKASKDVTDKIKTEFIVRQEFVDDKFLRPMPFLGISLKPVKDEDFYFRLSSNLNYNLPSLNDLYWFPGGNEDLLAEEGFQFDAGLNYSKSFSKAIILIADINLYNSYISNWIQWVPSDYRYWTAENIAFVHARGLESSLSINGKYEKIFYKLSAQYSFNKSTNESNKAKEDGYSGRQLIYVPLHSANMFAFASFKKFQINWNTQFTGKRNTSLNQDDNYSNVLPAYSVSNLSLGKTFAIKKRTIEVKFKVNNIFNNSFQAILWRQMPGRNFELFLSFRI